LKIPYFSSSIHIKRKTNIKPIPIIARKNGPIFLKTDSSFYAATVELFVELTVEVNIRFTDYGSSI